MIWYPIGYTAGTASNNFSATFGISFTGLINGTNQTFVPASTPHQVFLQGVLQYPGVDYNMTGGNVVFVTAPPATDDAGNPVRILMF